MSFVSLFCTDHEELWERWGWVARGGGGGGVSIGVIKMN